MNKQNLLHKIIKVTGSKSPYKFITQVNDENFYWWAICPTFKNKFKKYKDQKLYNNKAIEEFICRDQAGSTYLSKITHIYNDKSNLMGKINYE